MEGEKEKKSQLVSLKLWNGVNYYSGFTFSWDQGNNSKLIKQIPLIMQRRSHKVTGGSMFYIHEHIIKILRRTIKFYILILYPTALNPPNKKIRLFNDHVCHTGFICLLLKQMWTFLLLDSFYHWTIKNNFIQTALQKNKYHKKRRKSAKIQECLLAEIFKFTQSHKNIFIALSISFYFSCIFFLIKKSF